MEASPRAKVTQARLCAVMKDGRGGSLTATRNSGCGEARQGRSASGLHLDHVAGGNEIAESGQQSKSDALSAPGDVTIDFLLLPIHITTLSSSGNSRYIRCCTVQYHQILTTIPWSPGTLLGPAHARSSRSQATSAAAAMLLLAQKDCSIVR
nr:hypothetical protein CFP56_38877 [Quercus suber]